MSFPRVVFSALFIIGLAVPSLAQQAVQKYDPNYIPWKPQAKNFDDCGVQMKIDPRWTFEKSTSKWKSGKTETKYSFSLWDYWKKHDDRPFSEVMINPGVLLTVSCVKAGENTAADFKDYVKRVRKSVIKSDKTRNLGSSFKPLRPARGTGAQEAYYFKKYTRNREYAVDDGMSLYALHRGNVVSVFVLMDRKQGSPYVSDLPAGQELSVGDMTVKLAGAATKNVLAIDRYAYSRREKDNQQIIDALLKSFKAY